ncbi:ABC transporter permease [Clostridium saccharoperbutylacetonicum]|uniref:ABC transporter permease n=1 Tax=Clostridium saccharoperbutylacetonicum TaxID=36745 RepID=UPI0009840809|nr:ABC transporter permease [Clostridium saccharoperbutylacetonicum]AQR94169.1 ABC-2 family transporter protein [Clostridium saccharoperbutylacetonicum]NSB29869.1 ABC-2 type transport system permease protein [Clostridium saccharoperbutylacetonicum]
MKQIKAGIISESTKLFSRNKYRRLLICIGILVILIVLFDNFTKGYNNVSLSNPPLNILSILNIALIPIISYMAAADLFTLEYKNGSIKAILTRPISRKNIIITKMLSILIYEMSILFTVFILSSILGIALGKTQILSIPKIFLAYVMSIFPIIPNIFFSILISQFSKNGFSTIMLSILIFIILFLSSLLIPSISSMIFISYVNWYKIFMGVQVSIKIVAEVIGLFIIYSLIFFYGAYVIFKAREY